MITFGREAGLVVLGALLAGCAVSSIAGTATPVSGGTGPYRSSCSVENSGVPVPATTPTGKPLITITQGSNSWIANERTQPFSIAVYADGTAIRSEDLGLSSEAVAALTIGSIDPCRLADAQAEIVALAATDIGNPGVTDQGTTRVTMRGSGGNVVVDAYALGVDDQSLSAPQQAARQRLTALIGTLRDAMTNTASWTPDRLRVSTYGEPANDAGAARWPLTVGLQQVLDHDRHRCGVLSGTDADAVLTAIGKGDAVGPWTDGQQTLVLAIGPLVPGQQGCAN